QIDHALAPRLQHGGDLALGELGHGGAMVGRLDDDLVGPDAVHPIVDYVARRLEVALDAEGGKLVRHDTDLPSRSVRQGPLIAHGENLVGSARLLARAEGAWSRAQGTHGRRGEVGGTTGPLGGDDHPAADHRIPSELRHGRPAPPRGAARGRATRRGPPARAYLRRAPPTPRRKSACSPPPAGRGSALSSPCARPPRP